MRHLKQKKATELALSNCLKNAGGECTDSKAMLRAAVGYYPSLSSKIEVIEQDNPKELWLRGRFGARFRVKRLEKERPKAIVIALHGRGGSPEGVMGELQITRIDWDSSGLKAVIVSLLQTFS